MIGFMKNELAGKIMIKFFRLTPKMYSYLKHYNSGDKKAKVAKSGVIKWELKFEDNKNCLKIILKC